MKTKDTGIRGKGEKREREQESKGSREQGVKESREKRGPREQRGKKKRINTSVSLFRFQRSNRPKPLTEANMAGWIGDHCASYT